MRLLLFFLAASLVTPAVLAQDKDQERQGTEKKIVFDFSFEYDPRELYPRYVEPEGLKLIGPVSIAPIHIFLSRAPAVMYNAPPMRIWSNGWATSLWRDPVTGRPLM